MQRLLRKCSVCRAPAYAFPSVTAAGLFLVLVSVSCMLIAGGKEKYRAEGVKALTEVDPPVPTVTTLSGFNGF